MAHPNEHARIFTHSSPNEVSLHSCAGGLLGKPLFLLATQLQMQARSLQCSTQLRGIAKGNAVGAKATCPVGTFGLIWAQLKPKPGVACQLHRHRARTPPVIHGSHHFFPPRYQRGRSSLFLTLETEE